MRIRPWKRGWIIGLLALVLAGAALWGGWLWLPLMVERKLTEQLRENGFDEPRLQVRSVGLRRLEVVDLSMIHGPFRVQLDHGVTRFRPFALLRFELETLELSGLRIEWEEGRVSGEPGVAGLGFSELRRMALDLPQRIPLRTFTITEGVIRVVKVSEEATISFAADLTNIPGAGPVRLEIRGQAGASVLRVEGVAEAQNGIHVALEVRLADPKAWLALSGLDQWSSEVAQIEVGPLSTTANVWLPPGEGPLEVTGLLQELRATRGETHGQVGETTYHLKWAEEGLIELALGTSLTELRHAGLVVSVEKVAVDLQGLYSLHGMLMGLQLRGPEDLTAKGDVSVTAGPFDTWQTAARFEFNADSIGYRGIVVEDAHGTGELLTAADASSAVATMEPGTSLCGDGDEENEPGAQAAAENLARWMPALAALRGEASLGDATFGYEANLWQVANRQAPPELSGTFRVDAIQLHDFEVPEGLAGGRSLTATGEVEARGRFAVCPGAGFRWRPEVGLRLERLNYGTHVFSQVRLGMRWVDQQLAQVDLAEGLFLEGQFRADPFVWDLGARDLEVELELKGVSLERLAHRIPDFGGRIEGAINGRIAIGLEAGEVMIRGGRLELDPARKGRLQYDADGLLTKGMQPNTQEYRRLRLVEEGLEDLRLEDLVITLYVPMCRRHRSRCGWTGRPCPDRRWCRYNLL
jgi:hypothetical protein